MEYNPTAIMNPRILDYPGFGPRSKRIVLVVYVLAAGVSSRALVPAAPAAGAAPRKIVLIAGSITGHPRDAHEYEKSVILLKQLLDTAPGLKGITTEAHFRGWPADPRSLDDADTIVLVSDGGDRKETDHPLYVEDRFAAVEKQMRRGCGFVQIHWTTFHPSRFHDRVTEWFGGYFDYETGPGERKWYSKIEHATWKVLPGFPGHPILRGVHPFELQEEFYFNLRFREGDLRIRPILTLGPQEKLENTVAWALEREGGGRSFGFTGGHYFANWRIPDLRKMVLNAILWTAKADVPEDGAAANVEEPVKALIVTGYNHPAHDWRAVTAALIGVLEQDPRIQVDVTEDVEDLAASKLHGYGLLVLNYSNWDRPGLSGKSRDNFVKYLSGGGGLEVIHFANGAFNKTLPAKESDWEEFRTRIVRRVWMHGEGASGHDAFGPFRVEVTGVRHPITEGLEPFDTLDELYFNQAGHLPIDPLATARSRVTNRDEPMAWAHEYGRGRVFQTVLGHSDVSVRKAGAIIRRGAAWAAGRAQTSFDPPASLTEGLLFREGSAWTPERSKEAEKKAQEKKAQQEKPPEKRAPEKKDADRQQGSLDPKENIPEKVGRAGRVLPANPGLDGGVGGHWGVKNDDDWVDGRSRAMDTGPFLSSSLETESGTVLKAISIRVGEASEGAVCFDTGSLNLRTGWTGKFLALSPKRFGLIEMPRVAGDVRFSAPAGAGWEGQKLRYRGLHLNGKRVVLAYEVDGVAVLESPWAETVEGTTAFTRTFEVSPSPRAHVLRLAGAKDGGRSIPGGQKHLAGMEDGEGLITLASLVATQQASVRVRDGTHLELSLPGHDARLRAKVAIWSGRKEDSGKFRSLVEKSPAPEDLTLLSRPGPPRWGAPLATRGKLGTGQGPYVIDTLTAPYENRFHALLFLSGHDFFSTGDAAVSAVHGDVWTVSGLDENGGKLENLAWRRFATGLYQPLGLRVVDDKVYVLGRDQITRLHDENQDGEADLYECFNNDSTTTSSGHDYHTCLETDAGGSFYYVSPTGLHRVSRNGSRHETIAAGWRNPNGLSVGPRGEITVAPQEGEWTPASQICEVRPGGWYGYPGPRRTFERPLGYDPPLCWIPRHADNSTGGQVWVSGGRWGPLDGQLLSLSFGRSSLALVLRDASGGVPQGAFVPMKGRFLSGAMRGRFRPHDGQLYVTGLMGWVTNGIADGCFQRVRYVGGKVYLPTSISFHQNGMRIGFAEPLDHDAAGDPGSFTVEEWVYRYSEAYGSEEYSVAHPDRVGHDPVAVRSATVLEDQKSVFLEVPAIRPVMQMHIRASLRARDGAEVSFDAYPTINALGPALDVETEKPPVEAEDAADAADTATTSESSSEAVASNAADRPRGLILTLTDPRSGVTDARVSRLAALGVPEGTCPSPFLDPGPFQAAWRGHLSLDETAELEFSAEGRGRVKLTIDGKTLLAGEGDDLSDIAGSRARLRRGARKLVLEYDAPHRGAAWLRLYWAGRGFARETVPATAFRHDPGIPELERGARLREGRRVVATRGCLKCHAPRDGPWPPAGLMPELSADAPSFEGIGSRLEAGWMARWILSPSALRPSALMPELQGRREGGASREDEARALDIATYLSTLVDREAGSPAGGDPGEAEPSPQAALAGGDLFAKLGCIACHLRPDDARPQAGDGRIALRSSRWKWRDAALEEYLLRPDERHRSTRMPDFKLARLEAKRLAAFLRNASPPPPEGSGSLGGDVREGQRLVETLGCLNCHQLSIENKHRARPLEAITRLDWSRSGCAAEAPRPSGEPRSAGGGSPGAHGPRFLLSSTERQALAALLDADPDLRSLRRRDLAEAAARSIDALQCRACHDRDGVQAALGALAGETENLASKAPSAITVQARPALTFAGEQLHTAWLRKLIAGDLGYTLRPWLDARMPAFPAHAEVLAQGMVLDHGQSLEPDPEAPGSSEGAEIGKRLLGTAGGFSCITCHAAGSAPAQMQLHFGVINLAHARERIRHEFYLRWVLNPQRVSPLTMMPAYTDEDGRTALSEVHEGDGRKQFGAIWEYLSTFRVDSRSSR